MAAAWYRKAAERDIPKTQRRLGHMYEWNLTVDLGRGRQEKPSFVTGSSKALPVAGSLAMGAVIAGENGPRAPGAPRSIW